MSPRRLRCEYPDCPDDRANFELGRYCEEHSCEKCWDLIAASSRFCYQHKCTWPRGCSNSRSDESFFCSEHDDMDWSCQWSDSSCNHSRCSESDYCSEKHKCCVKRCPERIKRGSLYCVKTHACMLKECTNEATRPATCPEICQDCECEWTGCTEPKALDSTICAHHKCCNCGEGKDSHKELCSFCWQQTNCAHPDCENEEGSEVCMKHMCEIEDCTDMQDPEVSGTSYCELHRCTKEDCPDSRKEKTDDAEGEMLFCTFHCCENEDCSGERAKKPGVSGNYYEFCAFCYCKEEFCGNLRMDDTYAETKGLCYRCDAAEVMRLLREEKEEEERLIEEEDWN